MDIRAYIESGILEEYCLGLLTAQEEARVVAACAQYSELEMELAAIQITLSDYAKCYSKVPPIKVKGQIWEAIENKAKEQNIGLNHLPIIDRYSDFKKWIEVVAPLLPANRPDEPLFHELQNSHGVQQYLVVADADVKEEVHTDECERILILKGECACYIGEHLVRLGPGGFIEIPLHVRHNIRLLTPHVTAILQRIAV